MESYYDKIVPLVHRGSVIKFCEYTLDRQERMRLSLEIDDAVVQEVIQPNQPVSKDQLIVYYGDVLDDHTYLQLSCVNCLRLVLITGVTEENQPKYRVIMFNKDFCNMGLQVLKVLGDQPQNEPNYVEQMNMMFPVGGDWNV